MEVAVAETPRKRNVGDRSAVIKMYGVYTIANPDFVSVAILSWIV